MKKAMESRWALFKYLPLEWLLIKAVMIVLNE